jgi:hypothetical protein
VKAKGKTKAKDQATIPIPADIDDSGLELSDQDYELAQSLQAAAFLSNLDKKGIARCVLDPST